MRRFGQSIRLDAERGDWRGLRFTYGKNMAGCSRTVLEQDVYTALYGFGAGLPFTDEEGSYKTGYRRKLTFGDINGGKNYVADVATLQNDVVSIDASSVKRTCPLARS